MFSKTLSLAGLASVASAHILMTNPVPFGAGSLDNGPLDASGSNFPCKSVSYDAAGISNEFAQGSVQQLKFKGSAVHGGGSCQVSVTTDLNPTRDSAWKVIKSIEGGCPAKNAAGNIGDDASLEVPFAYDFTIPDELAAGDYVLAWTWFNKIGNREMYMNCAPLTVTGSSGDEGFYDTLPDMFVANLASQGDCATVENFDVQFPNPGNDVDQFNGATSVFDTPTQASCQKGNGGGNPTPSQPAGGEPPVDSPVPTPPPTQPEQPTQPEEPTQPELPEDGEGESPVVENPQQPGGDSPTGGFAAGEACSPEGQFNCIGGTSFQQCASGAWSVVQNVAAGTTCEAGQSSTLKIAAATRKLARRGRIFPIRF